MKIHLPVVGPELPVHHFTGLAALGLRRNGAPIWPVRGGAPDDADPADDVDPDPADGDGADTDDGADKLGDAGKQALDRMKTRLREERTARKALEAQIADANNKPAKDEDAPDPAELRKTARAEARAEVLNERALDKVEAKAAKLFADPEDARALLAGRVDEFVDDGKVDVEAIEEALGELLKKKPHLAAATAKRFQGGADGGARKGSGVSQVTEQDLKRMNPEQIVKAREEGRLTELLGTT